MTVTHLELLDLLHYSGAQKYCGAFLLSWVTLILSPWSLSKLLHLLISLILFLLEKLQHLEDLPIELVHFSFHALSFKFLKGTIHPSVHKDNKKLA